MEVVKKNIFSIVLGVIALLAVVAIFYPIGGLFDNLKKQVAQEAAMFGKAKQTYSAPHQLPITDSGDTEPKQLGVFPMPKIAKAAEECVAALNGQSDSLVQAAVDINKAECVVRPDQPDPDRMLLVSGSLPQPGPGSSADAEFKKALDPEIDHLRKVLDAATPPTQDDLDKEKAATKKFYDQKKFFTGGNGNDAGQAINGAQVDAAEQEAEQKLPLQMRDRTALNHHMYMDTAAIVSPREIVDSPQPPAPDSMYYAQAAIWMEEDICRAIAEVNGKSSNIMQSPVKRLVSLTIPFGITMFVRPPAAQGQTGGPEVGLGGPNNAGPRAYYALSATGRTANGMYDVVSAIVVVHVDATRVPEFLAALNHNRLMSVRNMSMSRVDTTSLLDQGYVYGPSPVAELKLDIEQLQLRSWTTPLMPSKVAALLGADGKADYLAQAPQPPVTGAAGVGESMNPNAPMGNPGGPGGFGPGINPALGGPGAEMQGHRGH